MEGIWRTQQETRRWIVTIFDIRTHLDFYDMLVEDFDDFMREQHSARRAFHCILESVSLHP